jgi:hypothetical protein
MFRRSLAAASIVVCTVLCTTTAGYAQSSAVLAIAAANPGVGAAVAPFTNLIEPVNSVSRPLPAAPTDALVTAVSQLSSHLGLPQDPGQTIASAGLPTAVAGRIANLLNDILACHQITAARFAAIPASGLPALVVNGTGVPAGTDALLRLCATNAWTGVGELELVLGGGAQAAAQCSPIDVQSLDIWPVLRFETGCANNTYPNDYLLVIDVGGNDTYRNNAGGNLVDVNFAPAGSAVAGIRGTGPARGCQRAIPGLAAADCVPTASVLLDLQGQDTYGVKQTPDHDTGCTNDLVVRRLMTGGAGFLGVGILRDAGQGADAYTGKTGALGAGHIFGLGVLSDDGGDDSYTAVRNSQGFALVGGFGLLRDEAGNDHYDFYMPAPINPSAPNQTEGAGGVRDDEGEGLCDRIPRFTQGAANLAAGSIGLLIDDSGNDAYHGAFVDEFIAPPGQGVSTRAGSLGFGNNTATGVFLDRAGTDSYQVDGEPVIVGVPRRANATTVAPGSDATGALGGVGLFVDQ